MKINIDMKDFIQLEDVIELSENCTTLDELAQKLKDRFAGVFEIFKEEDLQDNPTATVVDVTNYKKIIKSLIKKEGGM